MLCQCSFKLSECILSIQAFNTSIIMQHTQQEWQQLQKELAQLRLQNEGLKILLQQQHINVPAFSQSFPNPLAVSQQYEPVRRISLEPHNNQHQMCIRCKKQIKAEPQVQLTKSQLRSEWQNWSKRIQVSRWIKKQQSNHSEQAEDLDGGQGIQEIKSIGQVEEQKQEEKQPQNEQIHIEIKEVAQVKQKEVRAPPKLKLIDSFALFGPDIPKLLSSEPSKRFNVQSASYLQDTPKQYSKYHQYFYPSDVPVKTIKPRNASTEVERIIFKKSLKVGDSFVMVFPRSQEEFGVRQSRSHFQKVANPGGFIFGVAVEFGDYILGEGNVEQSISVDERDKNDQNQVISEYDVQNSPMRKSSSLDQSTTNAPPLFRSTFHLVIFTEFPFLTFLTDLLIQLVDQVKIKRMEQYTKTGRTGLGGDIRSFAEMMSMQIKRIMVQLQNWTPTFGTINIKLDNKALSLKIDNQSAIIQELTSKWAARILRLYQPSQFIDIFTSLMTQESLIFVSSSRHILTYSIVAFLTLFTRPFYYPYSFVSVVLEQQWLGSPFVSVMGLWRQGDDLDGKQKKEREKQKEKTIQQIQKLNKVIVEILNDNEVKVRIGKIKLPKSDRLKKMVASFYKKLQKIDPITQSNLQSSLIHGLTNQLYNFHSGEVTSLLPNPQILAPLLLTPNVPPARRMTTIMQNIEKYWKGMRRGRQKDQYIEGMPRKQMFYQYVYQRYGIKTD